MSQRSTSKRLPAKKQSQSPLYLIAGTLLSALFIMPTAQAASCKLPKSFYKNVSCTATSGYFLAIKDFGAPVAIIDNKGKRVIDLTRYQKADADKLSEGLLPVLRNGRVGYVNMQGREVVPAIYEMFKGNQGWARPVSEGRIIVKMNGDYGIITTSNQTIVPFSSVITDIDDYRGGVARVTRNQSISWLDKNGKTTRNPNDSNNANNNASTDALSASASKADSAKQMPFTTLQPRQQGKLWGFVDDKDVTMITYSFDEVKPFSEGLAGVRIGDKWGFVNLGGELVIPFRFDDNGVATKNDSDSDVTADEVVTTKEGEGATSNNDLVTDNASTTNDNATADNLAAADEKVAVNDNMTASSNYKGASAFVFKEGKAWVGSLKNGSKICIDKEGANISCN